MKYYVTLGAETVEVEVEEDRVLVGGEAVQVRLEALPGTPLYRLHVGDEAWTVAAEQLEGQDGSGVGRWALAAAGERMEVGVVDTRGHAMAQAAGKAPGPSGEVTVAAPMPGLVVRILVVEGTMVEGGARLVVLEAMKMENALRAPRAGMVGRIHVTEGQGVEKGAPLVTLKESEPRG
jgi:propionyl-CoA carboxylase alpha chain